MDLMDSLLALDSHDLISEGESDIEGSDEEAIAIYEERRLQAIQDAVEREICFQEAVKEKALTTDADNLQLMDKEEWMTDNFHPRTLPPYKGVGGAQIQLPEDARPLDYFSLFFTDEVWTHLVEHTNLNAQKMMAASPPAAEGEMSWEPLDVPTLKAYIGMLYYMGIVRMYSMSDYWETSRFFVANPIGNVMPRDKFDDIWHYFHKVDKQPPLQDGQADDNVRFLIDALNAKFTAAYTPYGDMTVDASMIKWTGKLSTRPYQPLKPMKKGINVWSLVEGATGYMHRFQVYTAADCHTSEKGLAHKVLTDLTKHLQNTNVRVYMDSYYTDVELLLDLKEKGILAAGAIRNNKEGLPPQLLPRNNPLAKHQYRVAQKGDLSCCVWSDTKPVMIMSNFHNPTDMGTINRKYWKQTRQDFEVPKMLSDYQKHMRGGDIADHLTGFYMIDQSHETKNTQWKHPVTGKKKVVKGELPYGWERNVLEDGTVFYVDHVNQKTTYTDPRLAFAEEVKDSPLDFRQKFDGSSTALQVLQGRDLTGKFALITGANCGIGLETARSLALHGATVVMACRNVQAAHEGRAKIIAEQPSAQVEVMHVDLTSLKSVEQLADEYEEKGWPLHLLILNAAVFGTGYSQTEDKLEMTFQVNHLAHFYLTKLLVNTLMRSAPARVIVVSSESHRFSDLKNSNICLEKLSPKAGSFWHMAAYNDSKLCNILFANELNYRLAPHGVVANSLHPGNMMYSGLSRHWWLYRLAFTLVRPFTKSMQQGAATTVYCSVADELSNIGGLYFNNCCRCTPSKAAENKALAVSLWSLSEQILNKRANNKNVYKETDFS